MILFRKNKLLFLCAFCIVCIILYFYFHSSRKYISLYLVSGYPSDEAELTFPSTLFLLNNKTLSKIYDIYDKNAGTNFIRTYHNERILICSRSIWNDYTSTIQKPEMIVINMNNINEKQLIKGFEYDITHTYYVNNESHQYLASVTKMTTEYSNKHGYSLRTINISNSEISFKPFEYLLKAKYSGENMYHLNKSMDYLTVGIFPNGRITQNLCQIDLPFEMPIEFRFQGKYNEYVVSEVSDIAYIVFENDQVRVIRSNRLISENQDKNPIIIHNKVNDKWNTIQNDEEIRGIKGFNYWIVGYIISKGDELSYGKDRRVYPDRDTGINLDYYSKYINNLKEYAYLKGLLVIYNAKSQKKFIIDTNQGDSEILLIENDVVYYRVYDEIYKADITDDGIENKELLLKDERVPDIHWAFLSEN